MKKALDKMFKRVLFISDTHCGHEYGLTPPDLYGTRYHTWNEASLMGVR